MKILVTGGAGFIGSNLIKKLKERYQESEIHSLDNYFTGKKSNHIDNVYYHEGNTWDIDEIFENVKFDIVYHFGEYSRIVKSFDDIQYVEKTIMYGTPKVLEMCRKWNSKLIYSASSSKFGNSGQDENLSPYSWMKSKMVELIKNYSNWFGLNYEICYFFNVYGEGQITEGDYATVIGIFERQYNYNKSLTVVSPGTQTRDFTNVEDIVDGIISSTEKNLKGEWHLRSGKNTSIIDIANMFKSKWEIVPERRGERLNSIEIITDTEEKLDWKPKHKIEDWINKIIKK
jgi:UDP-glucose 4-epimerase